MEGFLIHLYSNEGFHFSENKCSGKHEKYILFISVGYKENNTTLHKTY